MLSLTEKAVEKVRSLIESQGLQGYGLRVAVVGGGCSGFQYGLEFDNAARDGDQVFESNGIVLYVDKQSVSYLDGAQLDYVEGLTEAGFKFLNPKATSTCGCGQSFTA